MVLGKRRETIGVRVGSVQIGGGAPVVVQSMTNTATNDVEATTQQCLELAQAGAELVRLTVNVPEAAAAVPEIRKRLDDAGCNVPLIGDFHYNGHVLLSRHPNCASILDKYRINPGNVGRGARKDDNFATICAIARDHGKAVRIGVNGGSLDQDLVITKMQENTDHALGKTSDEVLNDCMVISALDSTARAIDLGIGEDQIVISCKVSQPTHLITIYRQLTEKSRQPLHLGLTEAGMGVKGTVWSSVAMGVLLADGIGDTIRVSLTPRPDGDRSEEVWAACEMLQGLGLRAFAPSVTACPGCGRTTSSTFQRLALKVENHVKERMPEWRKRHPGVEELQLAVMGCIVNGPGESKSANVGISLPGTGESPRCPVFIDGIQTEVLEGGYEFLAARFLEIVESYVARRFAESIDIEER